LYLRCRSEWAPLAFSVAAAFDQKIEDIFEPDHTPTILINHNKET